MVVKRALSPSASECSELPSPTFFLLFFFCPPHRTKILSCPVSLSVISGDSSGNFVSCFLAALFPLSTVDILSGTWAEPHPLVIGRQLPHQPAPFPSNAGNAGPRNLRHCQPSPPPWLFHRLERYARSLLISHQPPLLYLPPRSFADLPPGVPKSVLHGGRTPIVSPAASGFDAEMLPQISKGCAGSQAEPE